MLEVLVLGTAAGGGFPQWNCLCRNCRLARSGVLPHRLQSSLAITGNGRDWHLVNASPDVARQVERFVRPRLSSSASVRDRPIASIFLTNADLDHTLGVFQLREGRSLTLTAPEPVRRSLERGLGLSEVVGSYADLRWLVAAEEWLTVDDSGLEVRAVPLGLSGAPRYDGSPAAGVHAIGYLFRAGGATVGIFPDVALLDQALLAELERCERVWFDGTFWDEDELVRLEFSGPRAADMGHVPISGEHGSLAALSKLQNRAAYLHINNTNPILRPDSEERRILDEADVRVAEDGDRFVG